MADTNGAIDPSEAMSPAVAGSALIATPATVDGRTASSDGSTVTPALKDPPEIDGAPDVDVDGGGTVLAGVVGVLVGLGDGRGGMQPTDASATARAAVS
jgi:hypothetical protein